MGRRIQRRFTAIVGISVTTVVARTAARCTDAAGTYGGTVAVRTTVVARATMGGRILKVSLTTVRIDSITVAVTAVAGRNQTCTGRAALRRVVQTTGFSAQTAVGQGSQRRLTAVCRVSIAVGPTCIADRYARAERTARCPMRIAADDATSTTRSHIRDNIALTTIAGEPVTIRISTITSRKFTGSRRTARGCLGVRTGDSAPTAI
jgi:hypothetical protein